MGLSGGATEESQLLGREGLKESNERAAQAHQHVHPSLR